MIEYTLDEALSTVGFGTFQAFALVFAGIGWFSEAAELSLLSFIGPALEVEWQLTPTQESLISTSVFGGMLAGACFWGFISDAYGRRMAIRGVGVLMTVSGLLAAFAPDYTSLVIIRFFLGFGAAGAHVFLSWFLEFLPSSNRGSWMLVMTCSWILGELLEASLAWSVMPRLGWRWLLIFSAIPSIVVLLMSAFVLESPRYLFMKGRSSEAFTILEKVAMINRKELPPGYLVSDRQKLPVDEEGSTSAETCLLSESVNKTSGFQKCLKSLLELFSSELLGTTLLLWSLNFAYTFAYYGIQLMISALSTGQHGCRSLTVLNGTRSDTLYINAFITYLAELPGLLLAVFLVDRFGRKFCMQILSAFTVIAILPLLFPESGTVTTVLLIGCRMFLAAAFNTYCVYAAEVYPTSVRARGFGIASAVGRLGGMVCPLVAVGLVKGCHQTLAAILFGVVILLSGICVMFFPFEMKGKALADHGSDISG